MSQVSGVKLFDNQAPASITITKLFQVRERSKKHSETSYVIKVTPSLLLFVTLVTNIWPRTDPSLPHAAEIP